MGLRFEAWTLPTSATFEKKFDIPEVLAGATGVREMSGWSDASMPVPASWDGIDDLVAEDDASLVAVFNGSTLVDEFIAQRCPFSTTRPSTRTVSGPGINGIVEKCGVYARTSQVEDWLWGNESNILDNGGFEDDPFPNGGFEDGSADHWSATPLATRSDIQDLSHDHTGGTFTLSYDGEGPTVTLDWNATAANIQSALQALDNITSVAVTENATGDWTVEFLDPDGRRLPLIEVDDSGLTGGTTFTITEFGTYGGGGITAAKDVANARTGDWYGVVDVDGQTAPAGARRSISGLFPGEVYTVGGYMKESGGSGKRYRAGITAEVASHTNAYEEDGYWWAEVGNVTRNNGASDGTWQAFTLTFRADGENAELVIVGEDETLVDFWLDDWAFGTPANSPGAVGVDPWRRRGTVNIFRRQTSVVRSGDAAAEVQVTDFDDGDGSFLNSGIYQDLDLEVGETFQASVWVRHESGSDETFVWIAQRRTPLGTPGSPGSSFINSVTVEVPTGTWTELPFEFVADVAQVSMHLRWWGGAGNTESPTFYVDDATLFEGLAATTATDIIGQLLDAAHARGTFEFLELDATDAADTNGNALSDIAFAAWYGQDLGHVLDGLHALGYNWRIVRAENAQVITPTGTHVLQFYDIDTFPTDHTTSSGGPSVKPGGKVSTGQVVKRVPEFTAVRARGLGGLSVDDTNATALANMGRWEDIVDAENVTSEAALQLLIDAAFSDEDLNQTAATATVLDTDSSQPLRRFDAGDKIWWEFPGILPNEARPVKRISWTHGTTANYEIQGSRVLSGATGIAKAVDHLLRKFERRRRGGEGSSTSDAATFAAQASGAYIHLARFANQTTAAAGEPIAWTVEDPLGRFVFAKLSLPVTEIPIPRTAYYDLRVDFGWVTFNGGGSVKIIRKRNGVDTVVYPFGADPGVWSSTHGDVFHETGEAIPCKQGDTLRVEVDPGDSSQTLSTATLTIKQVEPRIAETDNPLRGFTEQLEDTDQTTHSITLPDTILEGDRIIAIFHATDVDENAVTVTVPSGFSELTNEIVEPANSNERSVVADKIADGTEGGTSIDWTTSTGAKSAMVAIVFGPGTGTAPEGSGTVGSTSNTPNPPSHTHSTSSQAKHVALAIYSTDGADTAVARETIGWPDGYIPIQTVASDVGSTDGATIGSAYRLLGADNSADPSAFTFSEDSDQWAAHTIIVPYGG